ncbi:MAG: ABC transporter ATP-binding protein [Roseburia sp.]|nr:ABC transporter ATP-binding protein [Roseburia sp.]MCM1097964.1 ABC transporter ATP-binding protein [Ruminococcus flavefaciens]
MALIRLEKIRKVYGSGDTATAALKDVTLEVEDGEFVMLTGKSGCGKTTLLNILGGIERASAGNYLFDGKEVFKGNPDRLAAFRNRNIGYVFQAYYLIDGLRVIENVELPLGYAKVKRGERRSRAAEALKRVSLEDRARYYPNQLSGGQQQRAAIARAIVNVPKVLLADEPTGNLDEENRLEIMRLLAELHESGMTIIMVTHDMDLLSYATKVYHMADGRFE